MWELDYKESWALKNKFFQTVALKKTLENPLDCKEIKSVNPKENQFWIFIGRADAEAETPILWPPDAKNWLIGKDPDAGKDCRWEKGEIEDEMVGWHQQLDGHEFEQAVGVGGAQGGLACCSPWGRKEFGHNWVTEWNWAAIYTILKEDQAHPSARHTQATSLDRWITAPSPHQCLNVYLHGSSLNPAV